MSARSLSLGLYAALAVTILDQLSKWWVLNFVFTGVRKAYVTSFFNLSLSWNRGVTFGLFNTHEEWQPYIFSGVAFFIICYLFVWLWKTTSFFSAAGIGFIMGGAIGNIIDRIRYGAVVDFLDFHFFNYHWFTFNVADSAIVFGVFLMLYEHYTQTRNKSGAQT